MTDRRARTWLLLPCLALVLGGPLAVGDALGAQAASLDERVRAAQRLSWDERFDAALEIYEEVLRADPGHVLARRERAKVLSWAGRYEASAQAFRALLADRPDDLAARLGLARVLSWSGRYEEARAVYQDVLEAHPGQADALLGIAQTWAWSRDFEQARTAYGAAARAADDPVLAETGLAYLDLWEGASAEARRRAETLAERYPGQPEVLELLSATRAATAPWVSGSWEQLDDSDRNLFTTRILQAGTTLQAGPGLRLRYADYDVRTFGRRGDIRSLQGFVDWMPRRGHTLEAMIGLDRMESPGFDDHDTLDWGLRWSFPLPAAWNGTLHAWREPFRYSVPLIDNRIVIESLNFAANGSLPARWWLSADLSAWDLSDGNRRIAADFSLRRNASRGEHQLQGGLNLRVQDWDRDLDNGYFDPSNFLAWGLMARAFGPVAGVPRLDYDVSAELGLQSFDSAGLRTSNDRYYLLAARLGWQLTERLRLEAWADGGSYASQGGAEWSYTRVGLRFRHRFGPGD